MMLIINSAGANSLNLDKNRNLLEKSTDNTQPLFHEAGDTVRNLSHKEKASSVKIGDTLRNALIDPFPGVTFKQKLGILLGGGFH